MPSANSRMTQNYGIDTSVLVRLLTGQPETEFVRCVQRLRAIIEEGADVYASNQVIGEAYVAAQHYYGVDALTTRNALLDVLHSGLTKPLNGHAVFARLESNSGPGLLDRLIVDDYARLDMETLDRKMASVLPLAGLL